MSIRTFSSRKSARGQLTSRYDPYRRIRSASKSASSSFASAPASSFAPAPASSFASAPASSFAPAPASSFASTPAPSLANTSASTFSPPSPLISYDAVLATIATVPVLYGQLAKKPPQPDQLVHLLDEEDAITTRVVFEDLLSDLSDRLSEKSIRSTVPFVKKPRQQDAPGDLERLVTHIGQMIDGGDFDDPSSPPAVIASHRQKLHHAMKFVRKARLSYTKKKYVDLMVNCDVYVSAMIVVSGKGMLRAPVLAYKCHRYLERANLQVVHPLPP